MKYSFTRSVESYSVFYPYKITAGKSVPAANQGDSGMEKHITLAGTLHIVMGSLTALTSLILFTLLVGAGILSGEDEAVLVLSIVAAFISGFLVLRAIPEIIGGIGLLKHRPWARILTLVVSCFQLVEIPLGTALGGYSLWVLLNDETVAIFDKSSKK